MKYGLTVIVSRDDMPGVSMKIEMPEVDREFIAKDNPALEAMFKNFDNLLIGVPDEEALIEDLIDPKSIRRENKKKDKL